MPRAFALFAVALAVLAQAPERVRNLAAAADQKMREEHFADAARDYEALLRLRPDDSEVRFALGVCYTQLDRLAEAAT